MSDLIWWSTFLIGSLILLRGFLGNGIGKYPFFYAYISSVLFKSVLLHFVFASNSELYRLWYWRTDILTLLAGCGIVLDIVKHVLSPYPGAERAARIAGLAIFGTVFAFVLVYPRILPGVSLASSMVELERDLRTVQALFLFGLLAVVFHYGIVMGTNIKGMTFGYGLYIGSSLIALATRAYVGTPFNKIWTIAQPLSWNISLIVWVIALWSFQPSIVPRPEIRLEEDYEEFASRTRNTVGVMRSYLARASRS